MSEILNVREKLISDENITKKEYQSYIPYIQSFKNNDEIRTTLQNQDMYVLPCGSYLYVHRRKCMKQQRRGDIEC